MLRAIEHLSTRIARRGDDSTFRYFTICNFAESNADILDDLAISRTILRKRRRWQEWSSAVGLATAI